MNTILLCLENKQRKKTVKKKDWINIGYYPTFEMAASDLIEAHISALDARKLKEVITAIDDLKQAVINTQPR